MLNDLLDEFAWLYIRKAFIILLSVVTYRLMKQTDIFRWQNQGFSFYKLNARKFQQLLRRFEN